MSTNPKPDTRRRFDGFESITVHVIVRVGRATLTFKQISRLEPGEVLQLDRPVGKPFELLADRMLLAEVDPVASDEGIALKVVRCVEGSDDHDTSS